MLTGKYRKGETGRREGCGGEVFQAEDTPQRTAILDAVIAVAEEADVTPSEIAIAWVAEKGSLPIIGPRTVAQLENNLAAARVKLSAQQIARLDEVSAIPPIFPHGMINDPSTQQLIAGGKAELIDRPSKPVG